MVWRCQEYEKSVIDTTLHQDNQHPIPPSKNRIIDILLDMSNLSQATGHIAFVLIEEVIYPSTVSYTLLLVFLFRVLHL